MKIRVPYVVVTAVKDKQFFEICFPDTARKRPCADRCKDEGFKVLSSRNDTFETVMPMEDATCEVLFHEVCMASEASHAFDSLQNKILPYSKPYTPESEV